MEFTRHPPGPKANHCRCLPPLPRLLPAPKRIWGWDRAAPGSAPGIVSATREKLRKHTRTARCGGGGGKWSSLWRAAECGAGLFWGRELSCSACVGIRMQTLCRITCPGSSVLRTAQCRDSHVAVPNGHSCIPARVCLNTSRSTESVKKKKKGKRRKGGGGKGSVWIPRSLFARLGSDPAKCTPQLSLSRQIIPGGGSAGGGRGGEKPPVRCIIARLPMEEAKHQSFPAASLRLPTPPTPHPVTPRPGFKGCAEKLSPPQPSISAGLPPPPFPAPRRPGAARQPLRARRGRRGASPGSAAAAVARATRAWQSRALKVIRSELLFPLMIYALTVGRRN